MYALGVMCNAYPKGLHNIMLGVPDMVLKYGMMLPSHDLAHIKPQLLLGFLSPIKSTYCICAIVDTIYLVPIPEMFHCHIICRPKIPLIPSQPPIYLIACQQDQSGF